MTIASVEKKSNFVGMFMRKDNTCLTVDVEEPTFPVLFRELFESAWILNLFTSFAEEQLLKNR